MTVQKDPQLMPIFIELQKLGFRPHPTILNVEHMWKLVLPINVNSREDIQIFHGRMTNSLEDETIFFYDMSTPGVTTGPASTRSVQEWVYDVCLTKNQLDMFTKVSHNATTAQEDMNVLKEKFKAYKQTIFHPSLNSLPEKEHNHIILPFYAVNTDPEIVYAALENHLPANSAVITAARHKHIAVTEIQNYATYPDNWVEAALFLPSRKTILK